MQDCGNYVPPSVQCFYPPPQHSIFSPEQRSRTPARISSSLSRLDMLGRKTKLTRDNSPASLFDRPASQEDVKLELRSQIEQAKDEIKVLQHTAEQKLIKKSLKCGLYEDKTIFGANKSQIKEINQMHLKMEVFEEETQRRIKELMTAYARLQKENVGMQRRITESVSQNNFEMQMDLLRSQFEEYQQIHTQELLSVKNAQKSNRFELESTLVEQVATQVKS